ncbi:hypothetical protein [Stenotrophobium rhamnosiphilum]|nr:hypothetical protein [Stenotrophobium rhamnosiphilum]
MTAPGSGNIVTFVETSKTGHVVQELTFELTNQTGKACIGGEWKKAQPIKDPNKYTRDPVYKIENGKFEVLLKNGFCDAYDSYVGQFVDGRFSGEHIFYGWSVETLGDVTGSQIK